LSWSDCVPSFVGEPVKTVRELRNRIHSNFEIFKKMSDVEATTPTKDEDGTSSDTNSKDELELSSDVRDIGNEAVWSLSTAKPGNGIDQIQDDNVRFL
jgi:hypothetical protein